LYRYVLKAITSAQKGAAKQNWRQSGTRQFRESALLDPITPVNENGENKEDGATPIRSPSLRPINETETMDPEAVKEERMNDGGAVTYRERLGAYLHPRDMRKLVTPFSASNEPELIVRRHAMLLNFDPLRAIILRDRLLVLVPDGADSLLVDLERRLRGGSDADHDDSMRNSSGAYSSTPSLEEESEKKNVASALSSTPGIVRKTTDHKKTNKVKEGDTVTSSTDSQHTERMDSELSAASGETENQEFNDFFVNTEWEELEGRGWIDLPFELQSVDAILHSVSAILADDVIDLQFGANQIIRDLIGRGADMGDHAQEILRTMKNSIKEMQSRVTGFCRAIDMVLEDYEDMTLMNLSRLLTHPDRFIQPVSQAILDEESDEPELILEAHVQRGNTLSNALSLVGGQISTTEDYAARKSDTIRNRLLYINMLISIMSLAVAMASFIGSIFGMNVPNDYEDSERAFRVIALTTVGGGILFSVVLVTSLTKLGALPRLF
jgi:magnesium transporter